MAFELSPCIKNVLASLSTEVLKALRELCTTAKSSLASLKISKQAISLNMDIALVPLQAKKQILDGLISTARSATKIIPSELTLQCPQIGMVNTLLEQSLIGALEGVNNMTFDIERLESLKSMNLSEIAKIDVAVEFFNSLIDTINEVLSSI